MYWKYKLPLIAILLVIFLFISHAVFKKINEHVEESKQENTEEVAAETQQPAQQPTPPPVPANPEPPMPLTPPKPFTVNEIKENANAPAFSENASANTAQNATQPVQPKEQSQNANAPKVEPTPAQQPQPAAPEQQVAQQTTQQPAVAQQQTQQSVPQVTQPAAQPAPDAQPQQNAQHALADQLIQLQQLVAQNQRVKARTLALSIIANPAVVEYDATWRQTAQIISDINKQFMYSKDYCPEKKTYEIQSGDVLVRIAYRLKTTVQALMALNKISDPRRLYVGRKITYIDGSWSIKVSKSQFLLTLYRNDQLYRIFKVGIGKDDRTPIGTFKIKDKVIHPAWDSPDEGRIPYGDPRNILGTRWMGLEATGNTSQSHIGYGIHGTTLPDTVGTPSSAGCVRLKNDDVDDLYNFIPEPQAATVNVLIVE